MQAQPLMLFWSLFTVNTPSIPLPWTQEELKHRKPISFFYCLKTLAAYTNSFISDCSCGSAVRSPSTYISFCLFSVLCFCGCFSPACLFPTFQKVKCRPNLPHSLDFSVFVLKQWCVVFVFVEELFSFLAHFLKEPIKQAKLVRLCEPQPSKPFWLSEMLVEACFTSRKSKIKVFQMKKHSYSSLLCFVLCFVVNVRHSLRKKMGKNTSIRNPNWQASRRSPSDSLNFMEKNSGQRL